MQFIDYYSVLGVLNTASTNELKIAYRSLVKKYHPDINHSSDATTKMQLLNEAYLILSDPEAKTIYDVEWIRYHETMGGESQTKQSPPDNNEEQATGKNYHFQSDLLRDWIEKAQKQARDITAQAVKDTSGIVKAAGKGAVSGIIQVLGYFVIINIIFLLVKSC
ncbi:MAG: DnaJ domain-containing protein [Taibaiella sp.]|nr:DnaJ domain-containing protein [Taibaiella sp.]